MKRILTLAVLFTFAFTLATPASAQQQRKSPHETISRKVDNNRITIVYGRPYTKDPRTGEVRKVWGSLVPYGKIWRLGADEATLMVTQQPIDLGGLAVPAGAYTLFFIAATDGSAQLIVNKEIGQWGIDPYHPQNELGRVPLTKGPLAKPVDQFTITLENGAADGGSIRLTWEKTQYSVPFKVRS